MPVLRAKLNAYLAHAVPSNRARVKMGQILGQLLTDENPPGHQPIVISKATTTGLTVSAATTTAVLLSGATTDQINITGAFTNGLNINVVGTTASIGVHFIAAFLGHSIETGTYQSTADGGVILTSVNTFNAGFLADDSGANIGASVRNVLARTLLTVDQSGGSIRSVMGQLKMIANVDLGTGVYTGVQGYLECVSGNDVQAGGKVSAFDGSIEVADGATLVVDASGLLAGIKLELTAGGGGTATVTQTGDCAAVWIDTAGTITDWKVGIDINNTTTGIDIGAATTGIALTGAMTTGISITGATTNGISIVSTTATEDILIAKTSSQTTGAVRSMTITHTMDTLSTSNQVEALKVALVSDVKTGAWAQAIFAQTDYVTDGLAHGAGSVICAELSLPASSVVRGTYYVWQSEIDCPTNCVMNGNPIGVMSVSVWGAAKAQFDTVGLLFDISGVTSGSGKFYYDNTANAADAFLKCRVNGAVYYIALSDDQSWA